VIVIIITIQISKNKDLVKHLAVKSAVKYYKTRHHVSRTSLSSENKIMK